MSDPFLMRPVGHVRCDRTEAIDDDWDSVPARIELDTSVFDAEALMGLDTFSHAEVIFLFDQVPDAKIVTGARHPRGPQEERQAAQGRHLPDCSGWRGRRCLRRGLREVVEEERRLDQALTLRRDTAAILLGRCRS